MATEVVAAKTYWAFLLKETFYLHLNKLSLHVIALKLSCIPERTRGSKWHQQITTTEHMLLDYIRKVSTCLSLSAFSVSMTTCSCSFSFINSSLKVSRSWLLCFSFSIWFCNFSICVERTHKNISVTAWYNDSSHFKVFWRSERNEMRTMADRYKSFSSAACQS